MNASTRSRLTPIPVLCLVLLACSDREPANVEPPAPSDCDRAAGPAAPLPLVCTGDCSDHVISDLRIPFTSSEAAKYSLKHEGKDYNALGQILALVSMYMSEVQRLQTCTTGLAYQGKNVMLLRVQAPDLSKQTKARAQLWQGRDQDCCPGAPSVDKCKQQGQSTCFSGTAKLATRVASDPGAILDGTAKIGELDLRGRDAFLRISRDCVNLVRVPLSRVQIRGTVTAAGIIDGVLAGTVRKKDVTAIVLPMLATSLDSAYHDQATSKENKEYIKQLFDEDRDGSISTQDLASSTLVKVFLSGDVCDDELSLGVGFSTVRAQIQN